MCQVPQFNASIFLLFLALIDLCSRNEWNIFEQGSHNVFVNAVTVWNVWNIVWGGAVFVQLRMRGCVCVCVRVFLYRPQSGSKERRDRLADSTLESVGVFRFGTYVKMWVTGCLLYTGVYTVRFHAHHLVPIQHLIRMLSLQVSSFGVFHSHFTCIHIRFAKTNILIHHMAPPYKIVPSLQFSFFFLRFPLSDS
jgi:hypothetical protein